MSLNLYMVEREWRELANITNGGEMSELVIIEKELSYVIMQTAFEVHNELGPGFPESIYEEAMNRELTHRGVKLERQKKVDVYFKGEKIGWFELDNIANGRVILEYKAVSEIAQIHKQQALSYLTDVTQSSHRDAESQRKNQRVFSVTPLALPARASV